MANIPSHKQLTSQAYKGVFWTFAGSIGGSVFQFVATAILARILFPNEFGIVAIALLYVGILQMFQFLGMGEAVIQKKELDQEDLSTTFWTLILVGLLLTISGMATASLAAEFFNEPLVKPAIICLSVNFIFSSILVIPVTLLHRSMKFKAVSITEIILILFKSIVTIVLALNGVGFWSIIIGRIAMNFFKTIFFLYYVNWTPSLCFNIEKFKRLFSFGKNVYGNNFVSYFNDNMDYIITGKCLGSDNLAIYQFAYNIPHLVLTHISDNMEAVTFPLYSRIREEKERLVKGYLKTIEFVSIVIFPLMFGLAYVADDFIITAYGDRWVLAILPLRILCLCASVKSIFSLSKPLLFSSGKPEIIFRWNLVFLPFTGVSVWYASRWGIVGVSAVMTAAACCSYVIVKTGLDIINVPFRIYFISLVPASVTAFLMLSFLTIINSAGFFNNLLPPVRLSCNILLGAFFYSLLLYIFFRGHFLELLGFWKRIRERDL